MPFNLDEPRRLTWKVSLPGGQRRLRESILYVAKRCEAATSFGLVKLNKILWRADFDSFVERGQPVTGRLYQRLRQGPAPVEMRPVLNEMLRDGLIKISREKVFDFDEQRPIALVDANLSDFSKNDVLAIDRAIEAYWDKTGTEVSDKSHGAAWKTRENGDAMPYELAYLSDDPLGKGQKARLLRLARDRAWRTQ